jgi:hypothetical protein
VRTKIHGREKGLCLPEALMTAAGLLLGSCAGLLAARRLCAISTRKRAGEGGPEAAQASWERCARFQMGIVLSSR